MNDNQPPTPKDRPDREPEQPEQHSVTIERAEQLLANGEMASVEGVTLWGSNYSALVQLNDGELQATAVYKPQRGERPLWDFPDGTLCYRETATYQLSKALDWHIVPPTVLREGPAGLGSMQLFVEHNPEINYFNLDDRFLTQLKRFAVFDFLINNADRKGGHILLAAGGKLWGIDHGLTFHAQTKLRTVIWEFAGQDIAETLISNVETLCETIETAGSPVRQKLVSLLRVAEISALQQRIQHIIQTRSFPQPGPGPNHPWPPV